MYDSKWLDKKGKGGGCKVRTLQVIKFLSRSCLSTENKKIYINFKLYTNSEKEQNRKKEKQKLYVAECG